MKQTWAKTFRGYQINKVRKASYREKRNWNLVYAMKCTPVRVLPENKKGIDFSIFSFLCPEQDSNLHILSNAAT